MILLLAKVEGLEVGLSLGLENRQGTLKLSLMECGCYVKNIAIQLDGGASWLYQGYLAPVFLLTVCLTVCSILLDNFKCLTVYQ